ncbi:hypothetical protein Taro_030990 [Colocasia esculenta]|uniref:Uncharacterized protein n=1 Tax=Colocasia esculenta TaxID=4460 RepID=A0A843W508_COLES|nr:hypothetical protein [Colocasia esculenta]
MWNSSENAWMEFKLRLECSGLMEKGAQARVLKGARHRPAAVWSASVVLVGLYYSLALLCGSGAVVGPFICDCETERLVEVLPVVVCPGGGTILVVDPWWYLVVVGVKVDWCSVEFCGVTFHVLCFYSSSSVVLVGLHCSLALLCGCGDAVGPFVCDCETERLVEVLPVEVCPGGGTILVVDPWWYLVVVGVKMDWCFVDVCGVTFHVLCSYSSSSKLPIMF